MTIAAGTRLGTYGITGSIDAGGMGEVYRARDIPKAVMWQAVPGPYWGRTGVVPGSDP